MTIRTLSLIPLRSQPSTFSANMEDLLSNLPGWTSEVNALGEDVTAKQITASDAATTALTAIAGVNATKWVSGTTYALDASVWSPLNYQPYRRKVAGAGTTDPSNDATNWAPLSVPSQPRMYYSARTSNTELGFDDFGKLIDITSGTFTQTFAACASLTNGWWCYLRIRTSGAITLDPYGSELVDGVTSGVIPKGLYVVRCDGSSLSTYLVGGRENTVILTSGTSWTAPVGVKTAKLTMSGGGGSGGVGTASNYGGPDGAGAGTIVVDLPITPGTAYSYAIGAGGAASASSAASSGNNGSSSTFTANGVTYTADGGAGGDVSSGALAAGGSGSGVGALIIPGQNGISAGGELYAKRTGGGYSALGPSGSPGVAVGPSLAGINGKIILEY